MMIIKTYTEGFTALYYTGEIDLPFWKEVQWSSERKDAMQFESIEAAQAKQKEISSTAYESKITTGHCVIESL